MYKQVAAGNSKINTTKAKKKAVLPSTKAAQVSTSRTWKGNSPSLSGRGTICTGENKRIANKSLHMSLSLGPSKPDPAPHNTMRKSSILEKMGDKEIVKQTFKTFQSINLPKSSGEERSSVKKQVIVVILCVLLYLMRNQVYTSGNTLSFFLMVLAKFLGRFLLR